MPDFAYIARDKSGQRVTGTISAANQREVLATLSTRALFPLHVDTKAQQVAQQVAGRRVKPQLMATFYNQLASLLKSGVPLLRSLEVLKKQSTNPALTEVLTQVHATVEDGTSLGDAMARYPRTFSDMAINMVRAGSEGGFLEDALKRVSQFTEQQADLKSRTIGALVYPLVLISIGLLVVAGLLIFIVPGFEEHFNRLRAKGALPLVTEVLLYMSGFLASYWWLIALVIIGVVWSIKHYFSTPAGKYLRDKWSIRIPGAGGILLNLSVAQFCRVLGTLLHNGVPIIRSLQISAEAAGNQVLTAAINAASENITAGQSLAKPLTASGHFPPTITEMIAVAEESNTLDTVLVEIADGVEKQTWRQLDLFIKLLEPLLLVVLAGLVLFVVVALLLPMFKISAGG
ncbi:MAG: type II secretion system F family protein [Pirellulales bacterium]|nr:type II secretion system F family protein [Pirellulales bacterium]